jgi:hypothetical protein
METIKTQIANAIARSQSHDEIVRIEIDGDSGDALAAINALTDCETDYAIYDREGSDCLDIWAIDGDMLWRLNISFAKN